MWLNEPRGSRSPLSKRSAPSGSATFSGRMALDGSAVTVCTTSDGFSHRTVSPAATRTVSGRNRSRLSMVTVTAGSAEPAGGVARSGSARPPK